MTDYYKILGLKTDATSAEIKTAYRKLSKKFHPDVNHGDKFFEELFKEIQSAYEVLGDDKKKAIYDERSGYRNNKPYSGRANQETSEPHSSPRPEPNTQPKQDSDKDKKATGTTSTSPKSKKGSSVWGIIIFILVGGFFHAVFKNINKNSDTSTFAQNSKTYDYVDTISTDTPLVKPAAVHLSRQELKQLLSSFEGVWSGSAYQYDVQETWAIRLTCRDGVISVKYPSLGCAGDLTVMESTASSLTLKENLTTHGSCYDNGVIVLSIEEDGRIKAFFNSPENTTIIALGYLKKIKG